MADFRIEVRVDHKTKEQAIALFESVIARIKLNGWENWHGFSCHKDGYSESVSVWPTPLTVEQRLARVEEALRGNNIHWHGTAMDLGRNE